LSILTTGSKEW